MNGLVNRGRARREEGEDALSEEVFGLGERISVVQEGEGVLRFTLAA